MGVILLLSQAFILLKKKEQEAKHLFFINIKFQKYFNFCSLAP